MTSDRKSASTRARGRRPGWLAPLGAAALLAATPALAAHAGSDTAGHTTVEQTIVGGDPEQGFQTLSRGDGEPYVVRDDLTAPQPGRETRRRSLIYLGQITDFQLPDEESPAREERTDTEPFRQGLGSSGFRPQEAMAVHTVELTIRQLNRFLTSPLPQGDGARAQMVNAVMTGDLADNMQHNETEWVLRLLEGGQLDPNSGTLDLAGTKCAGMPASQFDDPENYTGVQDYDDYLLDNPIYYDPEHPLGAYADWPLYPGLLDRAQDPFVAEGLRVPSYVAFGNHDGLYQGTVAAEPAIVTPDQTFEDTAIDCLKPVYPFTDSDALGATPDVLAQILATDPTKVMVVPPDGDRRFVDQRQFKSIFDPAAPGSGAAQVDAHGFAYIDPDEAAASNGYASYYSFSPAPGIRYVVLDTLSQAGVLVAPKPGGGTASGDDGNIDDPQFRWLADELDAASAAGELVIAFGHHARTSLDQPLPDEVNPCTVSDEHGHDRDPSCDADPRASSPIHDGDQLIDLFLDHPNVIAYVAGHSHENQITPYTRPGGGAVWEIKSPATADWPPQHRVIEVMDNRDGTLSIFATNLDHAAPTAIPDSGTEADAFEPQTLAAIGRALTYNDPHEGPDEDVGDPNDRNVELLIADPRREQGESPGPPPEAEGADRARRCAGREATVRTATRRRIVGTRSDDVIVGTLRSERIVGRGGDDRICARRGADVVRGGRGRDRLLGGGGRDRLLGGPGRDRCLGGNGRDRAAPGCERSKSARRG